MNSAVFSPDNKHRYWLKRELSQPRDQPRTMCLWVMLNPSTADCTSNDPTIKRCMGFTQYWGYDDMEVVNLFAFRATNPKELLFPANKRVAVGPDNNRWIQERAAIADLIICAWGSHKFVRERSVDVLAMLRTSMAVYSMGTMCIGCTQDGYPKHPLYVPGGTNLEPYPR